ncbi:hypothetical protein [Pseudoalteromonas sp. MER144-MNA-CIBAN-0113]|uniref:hypothetical protein n=1 Tax=Pseudoalteromonas sp. MER144-MNA-CIBAN-0113 TaxID=3140429 RepID=UPI00332DF22E
MKEMCPNCKSNFAAKDINNINKNSIFIEKQCPSCNKWFCLNKTLTIIKIIGIFLLLITSLLNIFNIKSEYSPVFSSIGLVGILMAIIVTFFGKHETVK